VVLIGLGVLLAVNLGGDPTHVSSALLNKQAPGFTLKTFDGKQVDLATLTANKQVVMVNFWNEWCDPCIAETPSLTALANAHKDDPGFVMVGVVHDPNSRGAAKAYATKNKMTYPLAFDPNDRTSLDYGVTGQPETFLINKAGIVQRWVSGPIDAQSIENSIEQMEAT
jgi:cytochrome c biogenesis protein CcmG/thiol:disulfide interchange protein DsbE